MKNWNSKTSEYTDIVGEDTRDIASVAVSMHERGVPVSIIAKGLGKSKSRIYQYLRK